MRQLLPSPVDDVDPIGIYAADDRTSGSDRPWLMVNMIASVDGGVAIDGVSGGLGGPADKAVFSAVRGVADIVMVASGTAVAENYRAPQTSDDVRRQRVERGQEPTPRIAIVTNSLSIDSTHRVFDPDARPLIITSAAAPSEKRAKLAEVADVIEAGDDSVDLDRALDSLGKLGARVVLGEGGPTLNGALVKARLVDEMCLSVSPLLIGGDGPRIVQGAAAADPPESLRLVRILEQDGLTFHRYVRVPD